MARFYGWIRGEKGKRVVHIGSETSGLNVLLNGHGFGVRASLFYDGVEDKVEIYLTGGSNDEVKPVMIGSFVRSDLIRIRRERKSI